MSEWEEKYQDLKLLGLNHSNEKEDLSKKVKNAATVEQQQKFIDEYVRQLPIEDIDDHMVLYLQHLEYLKEKRFNLNNIHQVYQSDDTQEDQHMQISKTVDQSILETKSL